MTEDTNLFMDAIEETGVMEEAGDTQSARDSDTPQAEPMVKCVFLGRELELPLKEAILWAQKGMNAEYAMEKQGSSKERELMDFYAAQNGMDRWAYMELLEKNKLKALTEMDMETISRDNPEMPPALRLKTAELRAQKRLEEYERNRAERKEREKLESYAPWQRLLDKFPEINSFADLPESIGELIDSGSTPLEAMLALKLNEANAQIDKLNAALAINNNNRANREKTVGSAAGCGSARNLDPFLMGMLKSR